MKIHRNLPQGGILVFLTGKKEITYMCKRLTLALKKKIYKKQPLDSDSGFEEQNEE